MFCAGFEQVDNAQRFLGERNTKGFGTFDVALHVFLGNGPNITINLVEIDFSQWGYSGIGEY